MDSFVIWKFDFQFPLPISQFPNLKSLTATIADSTNTKNWSIINWKE